LDIVLQASGEIYREEAISKQIELRVVSSTLEVHANAIALMRIAGNLVSNAVKHTERGKVLIGVRRGGRDPNGSDPRSNRPRIIVADTGKGMSTEDLARFKTAWEKGENSKGDGLGLAICFELAEEHGLTLDARSVPGKGTWFEVRM
ncbi:MAG: sensor histidine kinase, partial [Beijerinckiaceae bacterium]